MIEALFVATRCDNGMGRKNTHPEGDLFGSKLPSCF